MLLASAGCLADAAPLAQRLPVRTIVSVEGISVEPARLAADEFYFILIGGGEHANQISDGGPAPAIRCDGVPGFSYDVSGKSVQYDATDYPLAVETMRVLVAMDYRADRVGRQWLEEGCASVEDLEAFPARASYQGQVRPDIDTDVVVQPGDGFLSYNESVFVPMGKKVVVNLTRVESRDYGTFFVTGEFVVANLGAWKKADVTARAPG